MVGWRTSRHKRPVLAAVFFPLPACWPMQPRLDGTATMLDAKSAVDLLPALRSHLPCRAARPFPQPYSRSPNLVVTNHEAQNFPLLRNLLVAQEGQGAEQLVLFDRILCDVPCSGEGAGHAGRAGRAGLAGSQLPVRSPMHAATVPARDATSLLCNKA